MINVLDNILGGMIQSQVSMVGATQIGFDPPNRDWRMVMVNPTRDLERK